jgi:hypothetical protein
MAEKLVVEVGFDAAHGHYVAHHPELKPFTALSLFGLRKKIEAALLPETVDIKLVLNRSARLERDRRRRSGEQGRDRAWPQPVKRTALAGVTTRYRRGDTKAHRQQAIIALAGPCAEDRHTGYTPRRCTSAVS